MARRRQAILATEVKSFDYHTWRIYVKLDTGDDHAEMTAIRE